MPFNIYCDIWWMVEMYFYIFNKIKFEAYFYGTIMNAFPLNWDLRDGTSK